MIKIFLLTFCSMCAFAANSLLCRLALRENANDPASFTILRLSAGAIVLSILLFKKDASNYLKFDKKSLFGSICLFFYALFFSLSYVNISAGTGALILFACVQLTMMIITVSKGSKLNSYEKAGFFLACSGLVYLLLPQADMPPLASALMMALAGVSWGFYTLAGQGLQHPTIATARNFVFTLPLVLVLFFVTDFRLSQDGILYAILSGAVTSGLGYVLWYLTLRSISTSTAAIVQLAVPALTAVGGIIFLGETVKTRLIISSLLILGGIYLKVRPGSGNKKFISADTGNS